ncbi:MAG: glycosyltransferase family 4 protein [Rhodobiaceae bacterium]|nr:glycosyltransferase family 4 protein [Rhodobiaceae bacterium]
MSKPRHTILQVIPAMQSGGAELGALQVAQALTAEGHRSIVVSEGGRMVDELQQSGSEHITLPVASKNPLVLRQNARRLADIIRREKVDLIHARSRAPAWSCRWASQWTEIPFVTTYHSGYSEDNVLKHFYNRIMVKCDRVIAVSNWIADTIVKRYKVDPSQIVVIHRAVDPDVFDPDSITEKRRDALRKSWGIAADARVVLLPGRLARRKGQDNLIRAVAQVRDRVAPFVCILAGEDQGKTGFREQAEALAKKLGVDDIVKFVGHVDDMPAAYSLATVSISAATAPEGFQRGMLEAQAMGSPVLVSDVGPGIEVVHAPPRFDDSQTTGLNFDGHSVEDLARGLEAFLTMPDDERRAMGQRGSAWVRNEYTRQRLTRATLDVYDDLVSSAVARSGSTAQRDAARTGPTILQIVPRLESGGAERTTIDIARAIVAGGGRAMVASEGGRLVSELVERDIEWIRFPAASKNPVRIVLNAVRLRKMLRREGIDLVHVRSRAPAWSALMAVHNTGVPLVTTYHGAYTEDHSVKRLYNSVMARSTAVIANSGYTARLVMRRHGPQPGSLHVVPRGIDLAEFSTDKVDAERIATLRRAWRLTGSERVILLPARMTGWKGHTVMIEAAALLRESGVGNLAVVLAGDAQGRLGYIESLRARIAELDLESMVHIVGYCHDMPAAYMLANAAVVTSTEPEAFGRTAVEAQAMGCPVVVSDTGATPETVLAPPEVEDRLRTGWRVPVGSARDLAEALKQVLTLDPNAVSDLSARARHHVVSRFSLEVMAASTLTIYDSILGSNLTRSYTAAIPDEHYQPEPAPLPKAAQSS